MIITKKDEIVLYVFSNKKTMERIVACPPETPEDKNDTGSVETDKEPKSQKISDSGDIQKNDPKTLAEKGNKKWLVSKQRQRHNKKDDTENEGSDHT